MAISTAVITAMVGAAALLIGLGIVTGIVVNEVNKGETHKEEMMASPPPPPAARRELFETNNLFTPPKKEGLFKLKAAERATLASPTRRPLSR